jgi:hypothetical protein
MKAVIRVQHPATGKTLGYWRLLSRVSFVVVALVGITGFALPETALAGANDYSPTITVLVHNYSQASPAILAGAEREAGRIMGEAGLRAVWLECPTGPSTADPNLPCQKAAEATDIRLRVLAAPVQTKAEDTVFGFTVHPVLATVYYEYAVRRAKSDHAEFEIPIILGCVIAHELGHLLLGSNGHSGAGIMRPRWEPRHVRQLLMGTVRFTTEQAMLMRAQARTRMRVQAASLKEYRNIMVEHRAGPASDSAE